MKPLALDPELKAELDTFCAEDALRVTKTTINLQEEQYRILIRIKQRALKNQDYLVIYDALDGISKFESTSTDYDINPILQFLRSRGFKIESHPEMNKHIVSWGNSNKKNQSDERVPKGSSGTHGHRTPRAERLCVQ